MSNQDLQLTLVGRDVSASEAFRNLARAANQAAKSAGDSLASMNRKIETQSQSSLKSVTSSFGGGLMSWAQSGLAGVLGGIAASVTSSVMNVVGDAGQAVIGQLKKSVIDYNSTLEQATIGFSAMLGSGKQASKFIGELQDFGLKTPFQTDQLIQLSQQMMGYGVAAKNVIPYLTAIGDATAAAGRTDALPQAVLAFEQIASRGRVDLADINQLTAAGVPALKIWAGAYGTSTKQILEWIHSGKWAASDALPALINGIEHGTKSTAALGGMMEKQSHTFQGALSNIGDALNKSLGSAFQPVFGILEKGAIAIQKFATSKSFTKWANDTGKAVSDVMGRLGKAFNEIAANPAVQSALASLGDSFGNVFKQVGPALDVIIPNLTKFANDALPAVIGAIQAIVDKIPVLLQWWQQLSKALALIGPTVASVIGFLSDFAGTLFNVSVAIKDFAVGAVKLFIGFGVGAVSAIVNLGPKFVSAGAMILQSVINGILGSGNPIAAALSGLVANAAAAVQGQIAGLRTAVSGIGNTDARDTNGARAALSAGMAQARAATVAKAATIVPRVAAVLGAPSSVGGGGGGGGSAAKKSFQSLVNVFRNFGLDVGKGLQNGLLGSVSQIQAAASKMRTAVETAYKNGFITKGRENAAISAISSFTSKLKKLSSERAKVLDELSSLKSARSAVYNDTKSSTIKAGDPTAFGGTIGDAVLNLQRLVGSTKKFKSDLTALVKKGIDQTTFGQLVEAWQSDPTSALAVADGLLANPTDLKNIIGLQSQLSTAASSLGGYAGHHEYDTRVNNAAGKAKVLGWEMQAAARSGLRTVSRDLHIAINLNGHYAGTKDDLAKTVQSAIRDAIKKGTIPKTWAQG